MWLCHLELYDKSIMLFWENIKINIHFHCLNIIIEKYQVYHAYAVWFIFICHVAYELYL